MADNRLRVIRILYLITDLEIGGTERVLERLVGSLDRKRFDPVVVTLKRDGPIGHALVARGVRVVNLQLRSEFDLSIVPRLYAILRRERPDILHAFLFHANVAGRTIGRLAGVRRIVSSIRTLEGKWYHFPLERLTWRLGHGVVCASEAVREFAKRRAGIAESTVILGGVPEGVATRATGGFRRNAGPVVATAARLSPGKGVKTFLRAARIVAASRADAHFVVLGGGELEGPLQAMSRELGIAERVTFAGWRDDVTRALAGCAVFVHASRLREGLPHAVLEAMLAGVPVVATDVGGTREAVAEGETGFLVPVRGVEAIAERVGRLLADPEMAKRMGDRGREIARERFSIQAMVAGTEALYRSILRGSGSSV